MNGIGNSPPPHSQPVAVGHWGRRNQSRPPLVRAQSYQRLSSIVTQVFRLKNLNTWVTIFIALHARHTTRNSVSLISTFPLHSTSFFPQILFEHKVVSIITVSWIFTCEFGELCRPLPNFCFYVFVFVFCLRLSGEVPVF